MKGRLIIVMLGTASLCACMDVATTGAQAVYNRHALQKNFQDQYITMQANSALKVNSDDFQDSNIVVATYHQEVLLTGQTPAAWQREKALQLIKKIPEIKAIYNEIALSAPTSTLTRISDSILTGKVKARLMACNDVDASQVKVVTENGVVYLMGILPKTDATAAADVARETNGVKRVVTMFSYINISRS